ncbi:MAG: hypothetical protein J0M12_05055 [Deltaproteobacteria bacterium]|nr:hypothetical protein [Deltaproteobacteria bacterium]
MSDSETKTSGSQLSERLKEQHFSDSLLEQTLATFELYLHEAFAARRDIFVFEILKQLRRGKLSAAPAVADENSAGAGWVDIESLSKLRNVVGGRFENIKRKWVGAGFPLREHRGDKAGEFEVNSEGWVELSNWMSKHGYESRLRPDRPDCLFQIKALAKQR